ncbi:MAG: hypothetical protein NZ902_06520 [Acidilobaceae archaeon]|nr:hypothetical protein [Acidilobaceae archaeon]MDW7974886.1 hypothetical protein [Sulfolobales archaeon]
MTSPQTHDRPRAEARWRLWEWPVPIRGMATTLLPYTVPPDAAVSLENVYVDQGVVRRRFGWVKVGDDLDNPVCRIMRVFTSTGNERLFVLTTTSLYEWDYANSSWVVRANNVFNGDPGVPVSFTVHTNSNLYIANGRNNLYEYNLQNNTGGFVGISFFRSPAAVASIASRLVVFNVEDTSGMRRPNRVVYSAPHGKFDSSENVGMIDLIDPSDIILNVVTFRDFVIIRRSSSVWAMSPTDAVAISGTGGILSSVPLVFEFKVVGRGDICESPKSLLATNEDVYFVSGRDLRRLRAGAFETVLPIGQSLRELFANLTDEDMREVNIGYDYKSTNIFVSIPVPQDTGEQSFLVRFSPRVEGRPSMTKVTKRRVTAMGYGTVSFRAADFDGLGSTYGTFEGMQGLTFDSFGGGRMSGIMFGAGKKVFMEGEGFADSDGLIRSSWTTSVSNFGDPWYKVVERIIVFVKRGGGFLTVRLGRSFDGITIEWVGSQTKAIGSAPQVAFDWSSREAPMWVVEVSSEGAEDLQIGSILAYWRPTSPGGAR